MAKQNLNTACKITYPNGDKFSYNSLEEASNGTEQYNRDHPDIAKKYKPILSESAIKLRCNKTSIPKDGIICEWIDKSTAAYFRAKSNKNKGKSLEYHIRDCLREIGFVGAERAAGESKKLDNVNKVDIADLEGKLPVAIQAKNYANTPNYFTLRDAANDPRPYCVCWLNNKINKDNIIYMIPEDLFYKFLKAYSKVNHII